MWMLIAGHDTSTSLLAWTLHLLGQHPEIAQKAQDEVDVALGDRAPSNADLSRLPYLGQVIDESLRLYPPIHLSNRIAAEDIEFNGYRIPVGSRVMMSIYLTHRDPAHWPEPERFDPSRFDRENAGARLPYTYIPFGGGRRNCIGSAFARAEARIVLARILQRTHLEALPYKVRPYMGATLEPHPGVWMVPWSRSVQMPIPRELSGGAA
jgi:cytochrome P450